jgi:hypothetical protein
MKINKIGNVFKITIDNDLHCYAWHIKMHLFIFFDFFTTKEQTISEIVELPVYTNAYLFKNVFSKSDWSVVGNILPTEEVLNSVVFFRQDIGDPNNCWLVDVYGNLKPVSPFDCIGIERSGVDDFQDFEQRLKDRYHKRVNMLEEISKVKLSKE